MIHLFRSHLSGPSAVTLGIIWQAHDSAPAVCAHLALALYLPHGRKATHQDCDFAWNGKWEQHAAHRNPSLAIGSGCPTNIRIIRGFGMINCAFAVERCA